MDREQILADLNEILTLEYTAVLQYTYESVVLNGMERPKFLPMFQAEAAESMGHAQLVGNKIVALGGIPTTEVGSINPATELRAMLEYNLTMERKAAELYARALQHAGEDDISLRVMLENQVQAERESVEELERILR